MLVSELVIVLLEQSYKGNVMQHKPINISKACT